jgi:hypothetical protein
MPVCIRLNFLPHGKLTSVKSLRVWLLMLLTVLLPLRGTLAAAMMCPVAGVGVQSEVQLAGEPQGHDHGHSHQADEAAAQHPHAGNSGGPHDHASAGDLDRCNVCSAFCSVAGVVSGQSPIAEPLGVAPVFPHLYIPPPSFIADGQERPPRTI